MFRLCIQGYVPGSNAYSYSGHSWYWCFINHFLLHLSLSAILIELEIHLWVGFLEFSGFVLSSCSCSIFAVSISKRKRFLGSGKILSLCPHRLYKILLIMDVGGSEWITLTLWYPHLSSTQVSIWFGSFDVYHFEVIRTCHKYWQIFIPSLQVPWTFFEAWVCIIFNPILNHILVLRAMCVCVWLPVFYTGSLAIDQLLGCSIMTEKSKFFFEKKFLV